MSCNQVEFPSIRCKGTGLTSQERRAPHGPAGDPDYRFECLRKRWRSRSITPCCRWRWHFPHSVQSLQNKSDIKEGYYKSFKGHLKSIGTKITLEVADGSGLHGLTQNYGKRYKQKESQRCSSLHTEAFNSVVFARRETSDSDGITVQTLVNKYVVAYSM